MGKGERPLRAAVLFIFFVTLTGMGSKPPQIGGPALPFTLNDLEGRQVSLSDFKGKIVVLNFWATWCEPCKKEMPEIQAAYAQHKDNGLVILGIHFGDNLTAAAAFAHHGRLTFPMLLDKKANVAEQYSVISLPVTLFIDSEGIIRERVIGGTLTKKSISEIFLRLNKKS